jgi:hypothetical protein
MTLQQILADPSISSWLKAAIKMAYEQEPLDALRDAHRLLKMLGERYTQVVTTSPHILGSWGDLDTISCIRRSIFIDFGESNAL